MCPKKWREDVKGLTLRQLSRLMSGVSSSYLSRIERKLEEPSGKIIKMYWKLSGGAVTPGDFK